MNNVQLDSTVLGKILLLQNTLHVAPDIAKCCEIIEVGIQDIPGITKCRISLNSVSSSSDGNSDSANMIKLQIKTSNRQYGIADIFLDNPEEFEPYRAVAENTINLLALHIENITTLNNYHKSTQTLDEKVQTRTMALIETEHQFKSYIEHAPYGVFVTDENGTYVDINPKALETTGYSKNELLSMNLLDLIAPTSIDAARKHFQRVQKYGKATGDLQYIRKDGEIRTWTVDAVKVSDNVFLGFTCDITDRKSTENALRESERTMITLFDNLPGIAYRCIYDDNWTMQFLSSGCYALTGYPPEALLHNKQISYASLIHPEDRVYVTNSVMKSLKKKKAFEIEYRLIKKDGSIGIVWEKGVGVESDSHQMFIEGFITDVTQRKHVEAEIQVRLKHEQILSEISTLAIDVTNIDNLLNKSLKVLGTRLDVDRVYFFIFDSQKNELNNTHEWVSKLTQSQIENLKHIPIEPFAWWMSFMLKNEVINFSDVRDIPSEPDRELLLQQSIKSILVVPMFIDKELYGFIGFDECRQYRTWSQSDTVFLQSVSHILSDAIQRKMNTEHKKQLENQILQIQKLESIGRLAGGIAHDLNNLLAPILGYSEIILEDTNENDPRHEAICEIAYAGKRARDLVRQLLAFSRKQSLNLKPISLFTVLKNFEKLLHRTIREEIILTIESNKDLPPVLGDVGQLEQVVMNLAVNAQDAMPEGGKFIITTELVNIDSSNHFNQEIPEGKYIKLSFIDTGTGIKPDVLPHIFEPFFTTKQKHQGTGLGLSTVYGIIKQHSGYLEVESTINQGTNIGILLPVIIPSTESFIQDAGNPLNRTGDETILIAEDSPQIRKLTEAVLTRFGYTLLIAENGFSALEIIRKTSQKIDLLLADVVMPDINGKQLYEQAKEFIPNLKVAFMSGYPDQILMSKGIDYKKHTIIPKPFSIEILVKSIRMVLDKPSK